jgi:hypothetical protein
VTYRVVQQHAVNAPLSLLRAPEDAGVSVNELPLSSMVTRCLAADGRAAATVASMAAAATRTTPAVSAVRIALLLASV